MTFDLGEARRKRGRAPKDLIITDEDGGVVFKAPVAPEMPAETLDFGQAAEVSNAIRSMFIDPADADRFMDEFQPSVDDLGDLLNGLYGQAELGEALASGVSSTNDGNK